MNGPYYMRKITKDKIDLANSAKYSHFPGWVSFWDHSQIVECRKEEKKQFGQKKEKSLHSFTKKRILLVACPHTISRSKSLVSKKNIKKGV